MYVADKGRILNKCGFLVGEPQKKETALQIHLVGLVIVQMDIQGATGDILK